MIGKLRLRFIILAMLSMLLVLAVIIGGMNIINYNNVTNDADMQLERLAETGGIFTLREAFMGSLSVSEPPPSVPEGGEFADGMMPEGDFPEGEIPEGFTPPSNMGQPPVLPENMSAEDIFAARYFSVLFDRENKVVSTDTESIYMISSDEAVERAAKILEGSKTKGFTGNYRYLVSPEGDGTRVIFLDCSRSLDNFRSFRNASVAVSGAGLAVVLLLIFLLSGLIVRPAVESYEKQKRFITDAGHEIKTPLATINADSDVLEAELGEDNEWTSDIKLQVKRLTELTNDLVYLSKMEETTDTFDKEKFDLSDLTGKTAESFRSRALTAGKTYDISVSGNISITGDKASIRRVISILLDNAMKYSPDGSRVAISLASSGKTVTLKVTNDTKGNISPEDSGRIFDRFYRADSSRNSQTGGHGLGLSIAKAIVEKHKGKISASVTGDNDLTITVILPLSE